VQQHDTNDDALVEVRTGRAAAVLNDYPPAAYLSTAQRTQADYQLASDVQYEPGLYGIAVAQDREQLRDAVQATLETMVDSGAYEAVLEEWDVADGAIRTVSVNAGARSDH
jgi:polar amino acid transport system substrate-binding protein